MDGAAGFRTQEGFGGSFAPQDVPCYSSGMFRVAEPKRAMYAVRASAAQHPSSKVEADSLGDSIRHLRLALSVLTVAIAALRKQNADNDADVAEVLERYASDCLDIQIEKLEALRAAVARTS